MTTTVKTCFKCGEQKPLTDFYVHPQMGDGRLNKCKECTKRDVRKNYEDNIDRYRAYDRQRYRERPERQQQMMGLVKKMTPRQKAAHSALSNAIKTGKVSKPEACWHCGAPGRVDGHHVHYDLHLEVTWLCRSCHIKAHKQVASYA